MIINISGHNASLSESTKKEITERFTPFFAQFQALTVIDLITSKQDEHFVVEVHTNFMGAKLSAKGKHKLLYSAVSTASNKLKTMLEKKKGQALDQRNDKLEVNAPEIAYEKVQSMTLS
jgi:ribosomal subunit interface protein